MIPINTEAYSDSAVVRVNATIVSLVSVDTFEDAAVYSAYHISDSDVNVIITYGDEEYNLSEYVASNEPFFLPFELNLEKPKALYAKLDRL